MIPSRTLPRAERLRTLGAIRRLFESGDRMSAEVLFSVPKKFHKRANRRNLLRRRAKEAYRLNKGLLLVEGGKTAAVDVALIYSSKEIVPYKTVENALRRILQQIAERL